jgi:hypothetical protein
LGEPQQTEAQANFLQPWAFVTVTFLVILILFFIPCKSLQSLGDQRAQQTPEGLYQSTEKEGFLFYFYPWGCDLGFFLFLKILKILS